MAGLVRHMLPNAIGPLVVVCAANFSAAILIEAGLSFLGVGAQIPMPSWGNIVKEHAHLLTTDHAWIALIPGTHRQLGACVHMGGDGFRVPCTTGVTNPIAPLAHDTLVYVQLKHVSKRNAEVSCEQGDQQDDRSRRQDGTNN